MKSNITKRQHYIPRAAYLRNFSDTAHGDDKKNALVVYDKKTKSLFCSCVYDCAYEKYLYETPSAPVNALENIFAEIEGDFTTFLQSIIKICSDPANSNALILRNQEERQNLKFFVMTQYWRTSKTRDSFLENEYPNGQNAQDAFLFQMVGRDAEGNTGLEHYTNELSEHYFVFERNETTTPFVLADHPVLVYNRVDDGTKNYRLPLTPWLQAFLLDPKGNEGIAKKKYRNRVAVIKNDETKYVDFWNSESLNDAKRQIYVTPGYEFCFDDVLSGIL